MIEKSVFNNKTIKEVVKQKYNLIIKNVRKLDRGSANIYSLNNDEYILKEFQSKYTQTEIEKEIKIINHLRDDGINVPEYIRTINNEYSFVYNGKVVIMQKFIEGYTLENNTGNYEQMIESATNLGKIIKSLKTLPFELPGNDISSWYSIDTFNESIEKHEKLLSLAKEQNNKKIISDLKSKIKMLINVRDNYDFKDMKKVTCLNTHGDYSLLQFIYKNGKINAIIDFASSCKMPIIWEVIRSYSYIDKKAKGGKININNLIDYVKEFNKYIELNKYDIKYMPYLYLVQLLSSTFGYKQYLNDSNKTSLLEFAYFRTNLCKYLYKNANIISELLEKEIKH